VQWSDHESPGKSLSTGSHGIGDSVDDDDALVAADISLVHDPVSVPLVERSAEKSQVFTKHASLGGDELVSIARGVNVSIVWMLSEARARQIHLGQVRKELDHHPQECLASILRHNPTSLNREGWHNNVHTYNMFTRTRTLCKHACPGHWCHVTVDAVYGPEA